MASPGNQHCANNVSAHFRSLCCCFWLVCRGGSFLVNPGSIDPWWLVILAILPALLATILVFLDQQITAVIVNRKEHKLKVSDSQHNTTAAAAAAAAATATTTPV